jgi:hypothetical protein
VWEDLKQHARVAAVMHSLQVHFSVFARLHGHD